MKRCVCEPSGDMRNEYVGLFVILRDTSTRKEEDADRLIHYIRNLDWSRVPRRQCTLPED